MSIALSDFPALPANSQAKSRTNLYLPSQYSAVVRKVKVEKALKAEVKAICARTVASTWTENRTVNTLQSGRGEVK